MSILLLPGLGGSGTGHWQALWAAILPGARFVKQDNWDLPDPDRWIAALSDAVHGSPGAIVVAHSLGCIVFAHLISRCPAAPVKGALLVCPPDPESAARAPSEVRPFASVPLAAFPFPAIVVGSESDPFVTIVRARSFAVGWGARFVNVGRAGHVNTASGHGFWPEGLKLLQELTEAIAA